MLVNAFARAPARRTTMRLGVIAALAGLFIAIPATLAEASAPRRTVLAAPAVAAPRAALPTPAPASPPAPAGPAVPGTAPTPASPAGEVDPSWWDVPGQVRKAMIGFLTDLAAKGMQPVLDAWASTLLATPALITYPAVTGVWTTTAVIANALLILFVIAAGLTLMGRNTWQAQYGAKELLGRIAFGAVAVNTSLLLVGKLIEVTNAITAGILGQGVDPRAAATAITEMLGAALTGSTTLISLLVLAVLVMAIVVLFTFVVRLAGLIVLIGSAPLALLCHCSPHTEPIAFTWWRALACCMGIQVGQAVIMLVALRVFLTPIGPNVMGVPITSGGVLGLVVCLVMLWLMIKLPGWCKYAVLGPLGQSRGRGLLGQVVSTILMVKTLGAATGLLAVGGRSAGRTVAKKATTTAARPAPTGSAARRTATPRPPGTGARRRPRGVAGPAAFSAAPPVQVPLPGPAGAAGAPFSNPPAPASPASPTPRRGSTAGRFSHQPAPAASPAPTGRPGPVSFSHPPATPAPSPRRAAPTSGPQFSAAPTAQPAAKRPPAPVAPVFSHQSAPAAKPAGRAAPARPAAIRRTPVPRKEG
ncbi:hypothetical protein GCM10010124_40690 [Pilimelia terevasa]|uniref:Uncharacterized protein n=1 Tax=Pilimelia terevasa TaxID=53372 RepID=A0A8J3BS97_9ACTN|nr:hypothetical protein [Pilimelia terevasa]GGK43762.1 hypothetical protein GCM10010124_40690 [Pilimelia terevasa]